ncbi:hypothetical protein TrVE_jg4368 [Triparma verrucosa]|uniref:E3 ubiquitin protein ligase n=1 Tax=Triparma verrucosa TaxID=1606542 RepID=A0A9W7FP88_9STRA|nr:hypothetical protein TrVE_jg4368 [Triparma verrucosa]
MKRALKRAQSAGGADSSSPPPSVAASSPPPSNAAKRAKTEGDEKGVEPDGYFLKFQNTALLTELSSLKRNLSESESKNASLSLNLDSYKSSFTTVRSKWYDLESTLKKTLSDSSDVIEKYYPSGADSVWSKMAPPSDDGSDVKYFNERVTSVHDGLVSLIKKIGGEAESKQPAAAGTNDNENANNLVKCRETLEGVQKEAEDLKKQLEEKVAENRRANRMLDKIKGGMEGMGWLNVKDVLTQVGVGDSDTSSAPPQTTSAQHNSNGGGQAAEASTDPSSAPAQQSQDPALSAVISDHRSQKIEELEQQNITLQQQINEMSSSLSVGPNQPPPDHAIKSSPLFAKESSRLQEATGRLKVISNDCEILKKKVSSLQGLLNASNKSLAALTKSENEKWGGMLQKKEEEKVAVEGEVVKLRHKLSQAMEGARQKEGYKASLADQKALAESLQTQLTKLKEEAKSSKEKERSDSITSAIDPSNLPPAAELHAENSKLKNQLKKEKTASSSFINEIESLETERDLLIKTKDRLTNQVMQKEEISNKTMQEVMKLRELGRVKGRELDGMKAMVDSAEKVASNAKIVEQTIEKLKEELVSKDAAIQEAEKRLGDEIRAMKLAKVKIDGELTELKSSNTTHDVGAQEMKKRNEDLLLQIAVLRTEKNKLEEELAASAHLASKAEEKALAVGVGGGTSAQKIHIQNLRSKVYCHVCNSREKNTILTRCNHLFCDVCIQHRLENRMRKCPACSKPFDKKDVETVYLTG